jgi:hypothetical protein
MHTVSHEPIVVFNVLCLECTVLPGVWHVFQFGQETVLCEVSTFD